MAPLKRSAFAKVANPEMIAIVLDHATPAPTTAHAENHRIIREMVKEQGIRHFYDVGEGICHQVLVEKGLSLPGEVVLGSDSHTPHAGVMGAFGAGIGRSEMASIWATGALWLRVPESMKITVTGQLPKGVMSKDLALRVIGDMGADGALYMSVEWAGDAIQAMDLSSRATLPNLMAEMGAKNSYLPPDQVVFDYLEGRAQRPYTAIYPDPDAEYAIELTYDGTAIEPMVARPHTVDNVAPLSEVAGTHVDQAFIGACTNGRLEDLAAAAGVLAGATSRRRDTADRHPGQPRRLLCRRSSWDTSDLCGSRWDGGEPWLRPMHGQSSGCAGRGRREHQHRQSQLPGAHGHQGKRDLPGQPPGGRRQCGGGQDHPPGRLVVGDMQNSQARKNDGNQGTCLEIRRQRQHRRHLSRQVHLHRQRSGRDGPVRHGGPGPALCQRGANPGTLSWAGPTLAAAAAANRR